MTVRYQEMTSLATKRTPVSTRHVRLGPGFVQENQPIDGRVTQSQFKLLASYNDILTLLFRRPQRLFLKVKPTCFKARQIAITLQSIPNSRDAHSRSCSNVRSG